MESSTRTHKDTHTSNGRGAGSASDHLVVSRGNCNWERDLGICVDIDLSFSYLIAPTTIAVCVLLSTHDSLRVSVYIALNNKYLIIL